MNATVNDITSYLINRGGVSLVVRYAYNGGGFIEYAGVAARGSASSAAVWQILRYSYTGNNVTLIQSSLPKQIWDDRATTVSYA